MLNNTFLFASLKPIWTIDKRRFNFEIVMSKRMFALSNLQVMNSNTILLEENMPHNNDPKPLHY